MIGRIRKFSTTIFAKVFLFIVAIPFVFWGMGDLFSGGNQNTIVKIDKEKISVKEFVDYLDFYNSRNQESNKNKIEKILSSFIVEKLIQKEIDNLSIELSDASLSKLIKNENIFKKQNKFSRTEYEKFLISNSLSAVVFEKNLLGQIKKEQLLDFVGGGILPSKFLVNIDFDKINQKRHIQIIDLNEIIKNNINFSENQIQSYFNKNKNNYIYYYKTIKFLELNPENLTGNKEYGNLFFEKLDNIDDLIVEGKNLNFISEKFNLNLINESTFDKYGKDKNGVETKNFPIQLIKNVFSINEFDPTILVTHESKYFIIELTNDENIQKHTNSSVVKKNIVMNLKKNYKRKFISELVSKINARKFNKQNFYKFSKDENVIIKKITTESANDDKNLKKNLVEQIYLHPENKVILAADFGFSENYLVYIDKIEHTSIEKQTKDYKKYEDLSKVSMISSIYNTYDIYLKNKYTVDINYKALENIKSYIK